MNTLKNLTNKEMVDKIKDYADIADVAYAFFEYIDENEIWSFSDKFYNEKILKTPNPRWDYADNVNYIYLTNNKIMVEIIGTVRIIKYVIN